MFTFKTVFVFCVFYILVKMCRSAMRTLQAEQIFDNNIVLDNLLAEYGHSSSALCSVVCQQENCECFGFNSVTQMCRVHAFCTPNNTLVEESGWKYYRSRAKSAARCPIGWDHYGNSCYLFSKDTQPWNSSLDSCASVGASLVAIESQTEETFIQNRLRHEFASFMWWLGGTDQFTSNQTWYWVQTEQKINSGYTDWYRTEPDRPGQQHCLAMRKDLNYQWCDDYCPELHGYICEITLGDLDLIG
ncbi:perlucin-like protein [Magallana gigas]|uniref:perlucin-like protein n=1 Tax=Magallana gigas TaxID=29159 RepID=UPI003342B4DB